MRAKLDPRSAVLMEWIIGGAFTVSNEPGHGFLEAVYRRALLEEFTVNHLSVTAEKPYPIHYRLTTPLIFGV
ncbi:MAG: GxxExxY protein [Aliidongia sp.]